MKNSKLFRASLILLLLIAGTLSVVFHAPKPSKPLWPGSKFTEQDRDAAAERGLAYIGKVASDPKDRKSTRLNSSHQIISYAVFCLKKKNQHQLNACQL